MRKNERSTADGTEPRGRKCGMVLMVFYLKLRKNLLTFIHFIIYSYACAENSKVYRKR